MRVNSLDLCLVFEKSVDFGGVLWDYLYIMKHISSKLFFIVVIILVGAGLYFLSEDGESYTVVSKDGTTSLSIPLDALPEGVSASDLSISSVGVGDVPEKWRWLGGDYAFKLDPDGLRFSAPVSVSMTIPAVSGKTPIVYFMNEEEGEQLHDVDLTYDAKANTVTAVVQVSHFSWTIIEHPNANGGWKTFEFGERGLDFLAELDMDGDPRFQECVATRNAMRDLCSTHENWIVSWWISGIDWTDFEKEFFVSGFEKGKNQCDAQSADSVSVAIESMRWAKSSTNFTSDKSVDLEINCRASCQGWRCPESSVSAPLSESVPKSKPKPTPTHVPTPTPKPTPKLKPISPPIEACDIPAFQACANSFNLQGCIDACPYVSSVCPAGTAPNTDCKETDQTCSNQCWTKGDSHLNTCLASSNCTQQEVIAGGGGAVK